MKLLTATETGTPNPGVLALPNDANALTADLQGVQRIDLHFPVFTDGRAFSQARLLRERRGFAGEIRATGDVLCDQLLPMRRCGFDAALLRADQDPALGQECLEAFSGFYQAHGNARQRAQPSATYDTKLARTRTLLRAAAEEFAPHVHSGEPRLTLACSLGAEDMLLWHLAHSLALPLDVFVLDTGHLHAQSLQLLQEVRGLWNTPVRVLQPQAQSVQDFVQRHGANAMRQSVELRQACCHLRKVEPLARALQGRDAWITGMRREQSAARAQVSEVDRSDARVVKFSPLADWTWGDVWHYIDRHAVPYHPLHDAFYPSIGCQPCTRAISLGEDPRAGRWWWENDGAKECGLHSDPHSGHAVAKSRSDLLGNFVPAQAHIGTADVKPEGRAAAKAPPARTPSNRHLDALEEEAIFVLREVAGAFERPALLFSGGKDSLVLLRCAEKAFGRGRIPYPLLMIDTGHNFPEVTEFRDQRAAQLGAQLIVRSVEDSMRRGTVRLAHAGESRNAHQSVTLLEAIEEFRFDALIGGARRDEEKARAKERIFSHRDSFGQWNPKDQRPELWTLFNHRLHPGEHFRVFPISNWTELDVWQYIDRETLDLPSLYYSHTRAVVERRGLWVPVTELTPARAGETVQQRQVRFRTVGDITCTCPVESLAANASEVIVETIGANVSERGATRMDDQTSDASMEKRKKDGYF